MAFQPQTYLIQNKVNCGVTTWMFEYDKLVVALANAKADHVQADTDTLRALTERNQLRHEISLLNQNTNTPKL
jgi:hypothetical protein